ncbi:ATP-binding cassette domain-containing protein [Nocardia panacis]|uniref:ABC-type quaternary amine transporter n=1 Tax=Nocardia panacis TaxID=2340916 RepID=A0A3A4K759_9NOCA|nr:ATP-binding cassette domain-containing protein [Nocardia panacis]RJO74814.1 ATP-binding cassette domain-containing protein [Nocardia panacis]
MTSGATIQLDNVTKRYPGQPDPAVDAVTLTIAAGEIVVLVGPSGCGKTTTLRMINRLIEPTSGVLTIDGRAVTGLDPNELRRGIGYSIQQGGLFPHMTVARNVATVPELLGWRRSRTAARVEEMLTLVGLDPAVFGDRYPRQLSGGQQQRVGVARALAADPPVLLMDEPFGAVDAITRGQLQSELLRLQSELGKTIVFVTHDIGEAIRLGDRIAVLGDRSRILQYDTPSAILAAPADDAVAGLLGADAALRRLTLIRVGELALGTYPIAVQDDPVEPLRAALASGGWGLVLDDRRRPLRWVCSEHLQGADSLRERGSPLGATVTVQATLQEALAALLSQSSAAAAVVGPDGAYTGVVTAAALVARLGSA